MKDNGSAERRPAVDWTAARDGTLELWLKIRTMIDQPDELELLTEINVICDLCDVAQAAAPQVHGRCERCLAYQQFGGCSGINAEMSERVVAKDWQGLRVLVDRFIENLRNLELPSASQLEG
jgi:hypothetical protein